MYTTTDKKASILGKLCIALLILVMSACHKQSGTFEDVITHYSHDPADSLKLKAAKFLVNNIQDIPTLDTASVAENERYFNMVDSAFKRQKISDGIDFQDLSRRIDSFNTTLKLSPAVPNAKYVNDGRVATPEFLISNIDDAFYVWKNMAWAKKVSFNDFCEYILPYRCWATYSFGARNYFLTRYKELLNKSAGNDNCSAVGSLVTKDLSKWFSENFNIVQRYPYLFPMKFSYMLKAGMGDCSDANAFKTTALRSLGIPAVMVDIPHWGNHNDSHYDTKIVDPAHDTIKELITNKNIRRETQHILSASSYDELEYKGVPGYAHIMYVRTVPKVYIHTIAKQASSLALIKKPSEVVPDYFNDPRLKDVTKNYVETTDVKLALSPSRNRYVYLCVFDNQEWSPVAWAAVNGNTAVFTSVGKNIVYLPQYYGQNGYEPAGASFLLNDQGKREEFIPKATKENVILHAKFPCRTYVLRWMNNMTGGRFQLANKADMSDTITVHSIKKLPYYQQNVKISYGNQKYRYLIYQFKDVPNTTYVADIAFYGINEQGREIKLNGKLIGNPGLYPYTADHINDGIRTNLFKNRKEKNDLTYVGIDLGENNAKKITRIIYMPYGDDNSVVANDVYTLYYWDKDWIYIGTKKGEDDNSVSFNNAPKNALLLLKDEAGGIQERIFKYENGRQVFW